MQLRKQLWFVQVPVDQSGFPRDAEEGHLCNMRGRPDPSSLSKGSGSRD